MQSVVSADFADANGLMVGETLTIEFSDGAVIATDIAAIFTDDSIITGDVLVDEALVGEHARNVDAFLGAARFGEEVVPNTGQAAVASVLQSFPQIEEQTVDEFLAARQTQVDQLVMLANGLLALTIIIAMSGIANTVALSVLERTNEIGLLRSVGMSRRQVRSMIRHEALITSTVGAVLGVGLGVLVAAIGSTVAPASFINTLVVPGTQLVVYLVAGVSLGLVAAFVPAFRASRLNMVTSMRAS